MPMIPAVDEMFTIAPERCRFMAGTTRRVQWNWPSRPTARQRRQASISMSSIGAVGPATLELMDFTGVLRGDEREALAEVGETAIRNTLGTAVGRVGARLAGERGVDA